jgi:WD40 repeat protein
MLWPTDGHPASMIAILAHPGDIASISVSCDGRRLLTASKDGHVIQWNVNGLALRARTDAVGSGPQRWQSVLSQSKDISFEEVQRYVAASTSTCVTTG